MPSKSGPRRSSCPVSISLDIFGDRWSLLIVRDLMVRGYRTFSEMEHDGDGIATNILSDRLRKLEAAGLLGTESAPDGRSNIYRLTEKGIALGPVLLELLIWAARHESTGAPCEVIDHLAANRQAVLVETYRRWKERDMTPILPPFQPLPDRNARTRPKRRRAASAKRRSAR
jgi:DNA-binding HxlR family transcriptional regulator